MKCPRCGYRIPNKKIAAEIGRKGGSISSDAKKEAAKEREARKRRLRKQTENEMRSRTI